MDAGMLKQSRALPANLTAEESLSPNSVDNIVRIFWLKHLTHREP